MELKLQKRLLIAVLLVILLACVSTLAVAYAIDGKDVASQAEDNRKLVATVRLGVAEERLPDSVNKIYYYKNHAEGWAYAIELSQQEYASNPNSYVKVLLDSSWTAKADASGFGTDANSFISGSIYVPSDASITIDLQGYTIDRALSAATVGGHVFFVKGNLTIEDNSDDQTGVITGGYVNEYKTTVITGEEVNVFGGGFAVVAGSNAELNLKSGTITGNKAYGANVMGAAVLIIYGKFNMSAGKIVENTPSATTASYGGAICVYSAGTVNMTGGIIEKHTATRGGAICCYNAATGAVNINGGIIRNNKATYGGGIAIQLCGMVNFESGAIYENIATSDGGGVYMRGTTGNSIFNFNGGSIHHNLVSGTSFASGGALAMYATAAAESVTFNMNGGEMDSNVSMTTLRNAAAIAGGAVYMSNFAAISFNMSGGYITNNRGVYLSDKSKVDAVQNAFLKGDSKVLLDDGSEVDIDEAQFISLYGSLGGAFYVGGKYDANTDKTTDSTLTIEKGASIGVTKDGESAGNVAWQGGGIYLAGHLDMSGGIIANNRAMFGSALRPIYTKTSHSSTAFSGTAVIKDNIKWGRDGDYFNDTTTSFWDGSVNGTASNVEINGSDLRIPDIGKLEEGAEIHITVTDDILANGTRFTQNYAKYNSETITVDGTQDSETIYYNPYNYFVSDEVYLGNKLTDQHIVVLYSEGTSDLAMTEYSLVFGVEYSDETTKYYLFGQKFDDETITLGEFTFYYPESNYTEWDFGFSSDKYPVSIKAYNLIQDGDEEQGYNYRLDPIKDDKNPEQNAEKRIEKDAGIYTLQVKINTSTTASAYTSFSVMIQSKPISGEDVEIEISEDHYTYAPGEERIPTFVKITLKSAIYGEVTLYEDVDYTLSYENNINAGTATVIITFKGNYVGEARAYYQILPSTSDLTMDVEWEYNNGNEWVEFSEAMYANTFTYDGKNHNDKIRAKLSVFANAQTEVSHVYAEGVVVSSDELQNRSMSLKFEGGSEFINAGAYNLYLDGDGNYGIEEADRTIRVTMQKQTMEFVEGNFSSYKDTSDNALWLLKIGDQITNLLDDATYLDPDANVNEYGEKVTKGPHTEGGYARYRGVALSILLNDNYQIGSYTLASLLALAESVEYTPADGTTGEHGTITNVITTVVITFSSNYDLSGQKFSDNYIVDHDTNTLTLVWNWKIVTISNTLRVASTGADVTDLALQGWNFGDLTNLKGYEFRPEHGTTVIYSYYKAGASEPFAQFALIYSNDTRSATRSFYEMENGEILLDKPLGDSFYLYTFNHTLRAGNYEMKVTVPDLEPDSDSHRHWWDNDDVANDYGTRYYEFSYTFTFTVGTSSLAEAIESGAVEVKFPENIYISYNGSANNFETVKPVLILNSIVVLVEGEDYTLSSDDINVGKATMTITGANSFTGFYKCVEAYEIIKANNGWTEIPYIMHWMYGGFLSAVNLIKATPIFADGLYFSISTDEAGLEVIDGLDHIVLVNGMVDDTVAKILKNLKKGNYYLMGHVAGTDNYYDLDSQVIPFEVFKATNAWNGLPTVDSWIEGKYVSAEEHLLVSSTFGTPHVIIYDKDGNVIYDSEAGIDLLGEQKAGLYTLTASVEGTENYSELVLYTGTFEIFKKPGLPWWGTLLVAVGTLGVAALIIFILIKEGVFRIITDKILVAIRTRVSVESTIASVRAAKRMEEGKKSVEDAKRRERLELARQKAKERSLMSPEERAAELEAKAKAEEERAEKLRARIEDMRAKAAKVRSEEIKTDASSDDKPTEE